MDVRDIAGNKVELKIGAWYVGVNLSDDAPMIPAPNWHWGAGTIAQYVGEDCFYDDGEDDEADMRDYDYLVFQY